MDTRQYTFKTPLARALLDDPAFSSDPRSHPHFPLTHARSYKAIPPKSPPVPDIIHRPLKPVMPRKARMKALVRRLTTRHNLDRIDELDETDPFGGSYHHDGPYEAIGSNVVQPTSHDNTPRRGLRREVCQVPARPFVRSDPHPLRPGKHRSASGGLSLHLEPGQILQQNTIYTSHLSDITALSLQPNIPPPAPSRPQSLPIPRRDSSLLDSRNHFQIRHPMSLHGSRDRHPGDHRPNGVPLHPVNGALPHETEKVIIPPPRHDSRFRPSGPSRSPQRTPPPPSVFTSPRVQPTENTPPALHLHPRHKPVHSLDSSHTTTNAFTQSSTSVQDKPLDPQRMRHLPKRLVMPAPLQPRQQQPQYDFPPAEPSAWRDACPDDDPLQGALFERQPAMYGQEPRLLRKKSSAYPAKAPIPDHVVVSQDDAVSRKSDSPVKTANDAEGTKERSRRRRLSKRKNDT